MGLLFYICKPIFNNFMLKDKMNQYHILGCYVCSGHHLDLSAFNFKKITCSSCFNDVSVINVKVTLPEKIILKALKTFII